MTEPTQEQLDYLIVGQGLAGTLLTYFLISENKKVKVIDFPHPGAASKVAAGVINPVTGRRIAKSWRIEELLPFARKTYLALEELLGIEIWRERNILRALHNNFEENEWDRRSAYPEYRPYFETEARADSLIGKVRQPFAWGELTQSVQTAVPELVAAYQQWLKERALIVEENFDYDHLRINESSVSYRQFTAEKIIFCEGARAMQNPFFNHLPFVVTKGELLIVRIPDAGFEKMVKHKIFIVPVSQVPGRPEISGQDIYWVGSTSRWEFDGPFPTGDSKKWLIKQLEQVLEIPFEIIAHLSGIRPTVQDIRPFLGLHPRYPALAVFNGLGTKGASLGPLFAGQMAAFLLGKSALDPEVDISRFFREDV